MRKSGYRQSMLRNLDAGGFDENCQGVMMSGRTWDSDVVVIIRRNAITRSFPEITSLAKCVSFVERNLDPLRSLVDSKLCAGNATELHVNHGWTESSVFVEVTDTDLARSRRWLTP